MQYSFIHDSATQCSVETMYVYSILLICIAMYCILVITVDNLLAHVLICTCFILNNIYILVKLDLYIIFI